MKIIFAQGNPGKEYAHTRHNVGFTALDTLAKKYDADFIKKPKFHAEIAEISVGAEKVLLVKPMTFYNETGQAARLLLDFYKLEPSKDFLVIHDELALPLGTVRTRLQGSDAGNNGIKSLNAHIGIHYSRIRIGIYTEHHDRSNDMHFVLGLFTTDEKEILTSIFTITEKFVVDFIAGNFTPTKVTVSS